MLLLVQFLFRLTFGIAVAMAVTSPRQVSSGYYRNNLYVLLGMMVLAALAAGSVPDTGHAWWLAVAAAAVSYLGAVAWLYERAAVGVGLLWLIAVLALPAAWSTLPPVAPNPAAADAAEEVGNSASGSATIQADAAPAATKILWWCDPASGGLLLGLTMAAMLLGHWYLNAPGMQLEPLWKLLILMTGATLVRAALALGGLVLSLAASQAMNETFWLLLSLRWLAGVVGLAVLIGMTWQTLKIPNTQSATGMLYVAVIAALLGELTAMLLSAGQPFPL